MEDSEVIARFEPGGRRYVLVLAFDDLEDLVQARERTVSAMCGWDDEGHRFDKVEVLAMTSGAFGESELLDGSAVGRLLISSSEDDASMEKFRRELMREETVRRSSVGGAVADTWKLSPEHMDMLEKWADEAVEVYPAGRGWRPRAKTGRVREGFNAFATDHGAPELVLNGVHSGRAFVDFLRMRFSGDAEYARSGSNPYLIGLYRSPTAKRSWFPTIQGAPE